MINKKLAFVASYNVQLGNRAGLFWKVSDR